MFTVRYEVIPYIKQITFVFRRLPYVSISFSDSTLLYSLTVMSFLDDVAKLRAM